MTKEMRWAVCSDHLNEAVLDVLKNKIIFPNRFEERNLKEKDVTINVTPILTFPDPILSCKDGHAPAEFLIFELNGS